MTALIVAGLWLSIALTAGMVIGAAIRRADNTEQPEGIRDPENGAVWTETKRLEMYL